MSYIAHTDKFIYEIIYLMKLDPGLYIVSTPIGNLEDITIRALKTLSNSDIILCEDTRVTQKLLAKHQIKSYLLPYNDHSDNKMRSKVIEYIKAGKIVSLVSDAGTPLISDPGYKLVREIKDQNLFLEIIPGASSVIAGLTISGLPSDSFYFGGFLPKTTIARKNKFSEIATLNATLIFLEAANRLLETLTDAQEILGNREVCVARELTKMFQEAKTAPIDEVITYYQNNPLKGEIVLLIGGARDQQINMETLQSEIKSLLASQKSAKDTSDIIAEKYKNHLTRSEIYKLVNQIKKA